MNKILAAIGVLAVGGGLSLCDVCGATHGAVAAKSAPQMASVAHARAVVAYDPSVVTVAQMVAAIKTLGYTATAVTPAAT